MVKEGPLAQGEPHVPAHQVTHNKIATLDSSLADPGGLARSHEDITIMFMDIVGFTTMSKEVKPVQVATYLSNSVRVIFDQLHCRFI